MGWVASLNLVSTQEDLMGGIVWDCHILPRISLSCARRIPTTGEVTLARARLHALYKLGYPGPLNSL